MLKQRIAILQQGNVISEQAAQISRKTIDLLQLEYPQVTEEQASMFITHTAMAVQRVLDQIQQSPLDTAIFEEVKKNKNFQKACSFAKKMQPNFSEISFPEAEWDFLVVHLCNVLGNDDLD